MQLSALSAINVRVVAGALLISCAMQLPSLLRDYTSIFKNTAQYQASQIWSQYRVLSDTVPIFCTFTAALLAYVGLLMLYYRLCGYVQVRLLRFLATEFGTKTEFTDATEGLVTAKELAAALQRYSEGSVIKTGFRSEDFVNKKDLYAKLVASKSSFDEQQDIITSFFTKSDMIEWLEKYRAEFVGKGEFNKNVLEQNRRFTALSGRLAQSVATEDMKDQFVTKEKHSEDRKTADEALTAVKTLIEAYHDQHIKANNDTIQNLSRQREEPTIVSKTICLRIRTHTSPCTAANEKLQERTRALEEHDIQGHTAALLDHIKTTDEWLADQVTSDEQDSVQQQPHAQPVPQHPLSQQPHQQPLWKHLQYPQCPQYYTFPPRQYPVPWVYTDSSWSARNWRLQSDGEYSPYVTALPYQYTAPLNREGGVAGFPAPVGPRGSGIVEAGDSWEFDPQNEFGEY